MKVKIGDYKDEGERDISVKIDKWDTYSMDHTLAMIAHPMLVQLRDTTNGSPFIEFEDRPEHLIGTVPVRERGDIDEFHHDAWQWVLTEMIHAFESKLRGRLARPVLLWRGGLADGRYGRRLYQDGKRAKPYT